MKPIGRPPLAPDVSQIPATRAPAWVHDALAREASARQVAVAVVVREAVISHLETRPSREVVQTKR